MGVEVGGCRWVGGEGDADRNVGRSLACDINTGPALPCRCTPPLPNSRDCPAQRRSGEAGCGRHRAGMTAASQAWLYNPGTCQSCTRPHHGLHRQLDARMLRHSRCRLSRPSSTHGSRGGARRPALPPLLEARQTPDPAPPFQPPSWVEAVAAATFYTPLPSPSCPTPG